MRSRAWTRSVEWLAAAAEEPRTCKRQWDHEPGTSLLEAGRYWSVLSAPGPLGLLTLDLVWSEGRGRPGPR